MISTKNLLKYNETQQESEWMKYQFVECAQKYCNHLKHSWCFNNNNKHAYTLKKLNETETNKKDKYDFNVTCGTPPSPRTPLTLKQQQKQKTKQQTKTQNTHTHTQTSHQNTEDQKKKFWNNFSAADIKTHIFWSHKPNKVSSTQK